MAARLVELEAQNRRLEADLSKLVLSRSWRFTAPLRIAWHLWPEPYGRKEARKNSQPELFDAEAQAALFIRTTGRFDESFYPGAQEAHESGVDPIRHYVANGEAHGYAPAPDFDPIYYGERYPDVAAAGGNRFLHYLRYGINENRRTVPVDTRLDYPKGRLSGRAKVLIMVHDASRTGAPILAWNLVKKLQEQYDVIVLLRRGGDLVPSFEQDASALIRWPEQVEEHPVDIRRLIQKLVSQFRPSYAIANSVETRLYVRDLEDQGVPVVALVHEFSEYTRPTGTLGNLYAAASAIVFPAVIVAQSSYNEYPALYDREVHIMPQGPTQVPKFSRGFGDRVQDRSFLTKSGLLIVGIGAVHFRKGTDLFIAVAGEVRKLVGDRAAFLWVGHGYDPDNDIAYSAYLRDQINRSELKYNFQFWPPVDDVEPIYLRADLFLLSSRLDPLPNVAIDAALRGVPVICFDQASGIAEMMKAHDDTRDLVVPYLDCRAAARAIADLILDKERLGKSSIAIRAFAKASFDIDRYVDEIDAIGRRVSTKVTAQDARARTLLEP